jgi:hypothetical protein
MTKAPRRFTAVMINGDKKYVEIHVPYGKDGSIPNVVEIGSRTHKKRFKRTGKKLEGKWIYREIKSA